MLIIASLLVPVALVAQQRADPSFDVSVAAPAYVRADPRVVIDEAHNNFHTATRMASVVKRRSSTR